MTLRSSSTVLAGVKGALTTGPANDAGPALDPGSVPCSLTWNGAGLRPGALHLDLPSLPGAAMA